MGVGVVMKKVFIVFLIIVSMGLITGASYWYFNNKPNMEVISYSDDLYLIIEDIVIDKGQPVLYIDNEFYFNYNFLKEYIDENLFYDENEEMIIITSKDKVKRFKIDEVVGSVNSKEFLIDDPIRLIDNSIYIPMKLFENDYDISITYFEETNAVVVDYTDIYYLTGSVILDNGVIRSDMDIKAPIVKDNLVINDTVNVYGEFEKWLKVRSNDGILGFVEKKYIRLNHKKDIYKTELESREEKTNNKDKVNLTWDYTYSKVKYTDDIKPIPGINVISPTWFSIIDTEGNLQDKGNKDYVHKYKEMGYELWPLLDNSFNPDLTHELLKSSSTREKVILDIIKIYKDYGFNGINIDFENVYLKDKDLLTQFVRELYPIFKENNMIVSMDVTTISTSENWSLCYDRKRLHESLDYMMLMAYDQHWASSPIAGSVAEYSWVEKGLKRVLEEVPNEKLILAVPFYTRLWLVEPNKISSQSISMEVANKFVKDNEIVTVWNDNIGQFYGEITKNDIDYRIWLEDEKSLGYKISLIHKYDLAGVASWRKGFETENIWDSIDKALN